MKDSRPVSERIAGASHSEVKMSNKPGTKVRAVDWLLNSAILLIASLALLSSVFPIFDNTLYAPQSRFDFGSVGAGQTVKHSFTVRNLHPWSVTVTGVQSDCSCTTAFTGQSPPFKLMPLQAATIKAVLDTGRKTGRVAQTLAVTTLDDPQGTSLSIEGKVH